MNKKAFGLGAAGAALIAGAMLLLPEGRSPPVQEKAAAIEKLPMCPVYMRAHADAADKHVSLYFCLEKETIEKYKNTHKELRIVVPRMEFDEMYSIGAGDTTRKKQIAKQNLKPDGSYELEIPKSMLVEAYAGNEKVYEGYLDLSKIWGTTRDKNARIRIEDKK